MRMETKMEISRLCLILVGEEWTGKSSAGNTMLGQKVFQVDNDTEHVMQSFGVIEGRNVTVVDTPGWNSECSPDVPLKILKKGHNSVSLTCKGFHILLLTIPISQDQKWNKKLAQRLSNALSLFNNDIWKHTMLLFTRGDLLHSTGFEGYLKGSGQPFQSLVEKCECRYHVLDNHKWNDHKQVRELLEKIEQVVQENDSQSLQLVMSEQRKTLRRNEKFKMEEPIRREICFRLEDYMFKSLRPEENEPPDPTDQWELLRSNEEMLHPGDMQGAAHEYSHIQDLDTEFTHDLYSESSAEINRGLTMSSNYDCDTESSYADPNKKNTCTEVEEIGMDRIGDGDKEKNKRHVQHATLQRNTPQTWDDFITCVISSHQQNTKNGKKNPNIVERRQQSPKMNALSSSKLNHKVVRETEKTLDIRRVEFGGTRKSVRSQDARDEDKRENGSIRKMRRSKSLERFTVFSNAGEEDTIQQLDIKKIRRTKNLRRFITFNRSFHSRIAFPPSEGKRGSYSSSTRQSPPPKISKDHPREIIRNSHLANFERRDELFAKNGRLWNGKNLTSAQNGRSW
ncbi:hypothetical protein QTP86_020278 [Hemibagrus guttatus]|nr:hypothetical protein QTP86_020278 [Hemibagrus guttatus]